MARIPRVFVCRSCGAQSAAWTGRCHGCGGWATVEEMASGSVAPADRPPVAPLADVADLGAVPVPVGDPEIDRVLGGGLVPGSVTLLSGEPGIGKSTLTVQVAAAMAATGAGVLLVAGEEAPSQIGARARRLGSVPASLMVVDDPSVDAVIGVLEADRPAVAVIDSIQTMIVPSLDAGPGSVSQVRESAARLSSAARRLGVSLVLVGHVTKDGTLAGPRLLEHVVDTVLSFSGDRHHDLRFLRAVKHRFGPTNEVGLFEMTAGGLQPVVDPSGRFLGDRPIGTPGSVVAAGVDGHRPVVVEIQALAAVHGDRPAAVNAQGLSSDRVAMLAAVLEQRASVPTYGHQLYVSAAGGAVIDEPGVDLAVAVAVGSALQGRPVAPEIAVCGEVGLSGEVRSVHRLERRLDEVHRLGFRTAVVPASAPDGPTGLDLCRVQRVDEALAAALRPQAVPAG